MLTSDKKKIWGTRYSLCATIAIDSGKMGINLYFVDRLERSIALMSLKDLENQLRTLTSEYRFLDFESVNEIFTPFLKSEFQILHQRRTELVSRRQPTSVEPSGQALIKRIEKIEQIIKIQGQRIENIERGIIKTSKPKAGYVAHSKPIIVEKSRPEPKTDYKTSASSSYSVRSSDKNTILKESELLRKQGKLREYLGRLEFLLTERPNDLEVLGLLGNAYLKKRDYTKAGEIFRRVNKLDEKNFESLLGLAKVYYYTRRSRRSLEMLEMMKANYSDSEEVWTLFSMAYEAIGDSDRSIECLDRASKIGLSKMRKKT